MAEGPTVGFTDGTPSFEVFCRRGGHPEFHESRNEAAPGATFADKADPKSGRGNWRSVVESFQEARGAHGGRNRLPDGRPARADAGRREYPVSAASKPWGNRAV